MHDLSGNNGRQNSICMLTQTGCASGEVVLKRRQPRGNCLGVEDIQIRDKSLEKESTIKETPSPGRLEGQHSDGLLQREVATLAYPMGKKVRRNRAV